MQIKEIFIKRNSFNPTGISVLPRSDGKLTAVCPRFWKSLKSHKNLHLRLKTFQKPLLILHGSADTYVPLEGVKRFYQKISGKKKIKIYEDGDHGIEFPREKRQEVLQDLVD